MESRISSCFTYWFNLQLATVRSMQVRGRVVPRGTLPIFPSGTITKFIKMVRKSPYYFLKHANSVVAFEICSIFEAFI